ncbi:MAG: hypothetical protein JWM96_1202 [Alphaproteobacteria bacterium]|nr:hypothetical protein [Alphaproteobacteria bacterium]
MTILLVRHAESEGNVDHKIFLDKADHALHLSPKGEEQARALGLFLKDYYAANPPKKNIRLWCSPYQRTLSTLKGMRETMGEWVWNKCGRGRDVHFDDRLRERHWGFHQPHEYQPGGSVEKQNPHLFKHFRTTRDTPMGRYFAQPFGGESAADTVSRLHSFFHDLHFDIQRGVTDHIIVTHALTMMAFVYGFTKLHPQFFDDEVLADNTGVRLLDIDPETGRYADYGYIYNPSTNVYLTQKPARPVQRDLESLWR